MMRLKTILAAIGRFIPAWVAAALLTTIAATLLQTQNVIARLNGLGAEIGLGSRVSMSVYDLAHLGTLYVVFIALGTLVAYLAGLLVDRLAGFGRPVVFAVAGAVAMLVMLTLMKEAFFGVQLIAGARDTVGMVFQMVAGGLGGLVFAAMSHRLSPTARVSVAV